MIHKILNRVRVNFRQSRSDRSATGQYRNYKKSVTHLFKKVPLFNTKKGQIK
jgi:hypothetical protein